MPSQPDHPSLPDVCRCDAPLRFKDPETKRWRCAKCSHDVIPPLMLKPKEK